MHDGNRGDRTKTGLIAGILVAALFVIIFAWPAFLTQREIQDDASRNANYYSESAQKNVTVKCLNLSGQARADCAQPIEDAAREAQRNEYDLAAQQTMAVWTAVMGGVAILGVALSGIGVYLIWGTWTQSADAAISARRTLDSYIARERAILRPVEASLNYSDKGPPEHNGICVGFENIGNSVGHVQKIEWEIFNVKTWPQEFEHSDNRRFAVPHNSRGESYRLDFGFPPDRPFWLMGAAEYTTLHGEIFKTHFCIAAERTHETGHGLARGSLYPIRIASMPQDT